MIDQILESDPILKYIKKHKGNLDKAFTFRKQLYSSLFAKNRVLIEKNLQYIIYKSTDLGHKVNLCEFISPKNFDEKSFLNVINETRLVDRRVAKLNFSMAYNSKIHKFFLKQKMDITGILLIGKVVDGLEKLGPIKKSQITLSLMQEDEIEEVLNLEVLAHRKSQTSRVRNYSKEKARGLFTFLFSKKLAFVAKNKTGEIIGVVGFNFDVMECGYVMCIAVHPDFQGQGISKLLYQRILLEFKKKKIKFYLGTTTTTEVLGFAKKLKRTPIGITFVC